MSLTIQKAALHKTRHSLYKAPAPTNSKSTCCLVLYSICTCMQFRNVKCSTLTFRTSWRTDLMRRWMRTLIGVQTCGGTNPTARISNMWSGWLTYYTWSDGYGTDGECFVNSLKFAYYGLC